MKKTVYRFEYFDRKTKAVQVAVDYATEEAIEQMGATLMLDSALVVDAGRIGSAGLLLPADDAQ